ncbi:MAG: hypothetical protein SFV24_18980, partial [Gemmatimonadales bacterium]|nr:hypothetical protein [Gemmatimonadales bacterium]
SIRWYMSNDYAERARRRDRWHRAVNAFHWPAEGPKRTHDKWMYEAMDMASEVERLPLLFRKEREGGLTKVHQQCSLSPTEPVADNHLTCCLGIECRKCPQLLALESAELSPEEIDRAKAWTCVAHIAMSGGDPAGEGYILTTDDRMFWDRTYASMAGEDQEPCPTNSAGDG